MSVFIIADAGSNARPSLRTALRLVTEAKMSGADAFKLQLWHADHLYPKGTKEHAAAKKWAFPERWLDRVKTECDGLGIEFMCSAFCYDALDTIDPLVKRHKIAGIEAHDVGFVVEVLSRRKPVILTRSLGLPAWKLLLYRVLAVVLRAPLTVLHGVTAYPAPIDEMGLVAHPRGRWGVSDHSTDPVIIPVSAAALGATVVEKHIRLRGQRNTPDGPHSLDPADFAGMVACITLAEGARRPQTGVHDAEKENLRLLRKDGLRQT